MMNSLNVYDAEQTVREIFAKSADIIRSEQPHQHISDYVKKRFEMHYDSGKLLVDTNWWRVFGVYQEITHPVVLENITILHDTLRDVCSDQLNSINN